MLSSRYLHLHEALGLGPMWLKQNAKVLPKTQAQSAGNAATVQHTHTAQTAIATVQPANHAAAARLAAIAKVLPKTQVQSAGSAATAQHTHTAQAATATAQPANHAAAARLAAIAAVAKAVDNANSKPAAAYTPQEQTHQAETTIGVAVKPVQIMVVSTCPSPEDSAAGQLFSGETGILLNRMLEAINLKPADVHKTSWVKQAAIFTPEPSPEQLAELLPQMQAELAACQAQAVLFLGKLFTQQSYIQTIKHLCGNTPYFTVPHPARLLRQPQLKKTAWEELKKLRNVLSSPAL